MSQFITKKRDDILAKIVRQTSVLVLSTTTDTGHVFGYVCHRYRNRGILGLCDASDRGVIVEHSITIERSDLQYTCGMFEEVIDERVYKDERSPMI